MKFDEIQLCGLKFSTTVNDNDSIISIQKYQYIMAVYLISYIQCSNGTESTDTSFHRMYCCSLFSLVAEGGYHIKQGRRENHAVATARLWFKMSSPNLAV